MKRPGTRFYVSLGIASLHASLLFMAIYMGLLPDRVGAIRMGRAALAESVAASTSSAVMRQDFEPLQAGLEFIVERNPDLLSAAVRRADGKTVALVGDHLRQWKMAPGSKSTDAEVQVAILSADRDWGYVQLRFEPLAAPGLQGLVSDPRVRLVSFFVVCSLIASYFYLGRVLRQLDPSRAVPGRVRAALDTMAEGLLVIDLQGYIVLANQAFASVVGQDADRLVGKSVSDFAWTNADGTPIPEQLYTWRLALEHGAPQRNARIHFKAHNGSLRSFIVNCSPISGSGGRHGGVLISFDDVTELQEKEIELRTAKDEADAANRAKSQFLANMSHEIRTPMNAILGFTELLRRGYHKDSGEMKRHLNTIHSSGKHLLEVINDILDLAKVESGQLELERTQCAVHSVVRDVLDVLNVRATEKGIGLRMDCRGPFPETVQTDPARLRQVVTNIVGNAIKFTETGGVTVTLGVTGSQANPLVCIDVADTGVGIPADKVESIFEPFVQAEASTTRKFGGTGLGLTISRRFARAMGGDIVARSQPGKGSVFHITLDPGALHDVKMIDPTEVLAHAEQATANVSTAWRFPAAHVLVVDDGAANRDLVRLVLEEAGLRVSQAENGQIGVETAMREQVDLILMDMQMPVMDGYTATRTLRERGLNLPIIALTAHAMKGFEEEILKSGCSGYMTKPIDIDLLLQTLATLLGGTRTELDGPQPRPPMATRPNEESQASDAPIVSRLEQHPRLRRVAHSFARQMPERMQAITRAWECRDFEGLYALAHWLKGSGGTAGFDMFTAPASKLEALAKQRDEGQMPQVLDELQGIVARIEINQAEPREELQSA
jgi:PAS domain S-box-containing protein